MNLVDLKTNRFIQFMEMAVNNPTLLHLLNELPDDDMAGLLKIASDAGFRLSIEEVNAVVQQTLFNKLPDGELVDDDLDFVVGGTNKPYQLQSVLSNIIQSLNQKANII